MVHTADEDVLTPSEIDELMPFGHERSERRTVPCVGLFCFIGAVPATDWLKGTVEFDDGGFVVTDHSLPPALAGIRRPLQFETSLPGVFAVGDVRQGSLKRVAAAVGEGSSAVRSVHDYLEAMGHTS